MHECSKDETEEALERDVALWCRLWFERNAGFRIKRDASRQFSKEMLVWLKVRSAASTTSQFEEGHDHA